MSELIDLLFLTGLGNDRGPALRNVLVVHCVGATVGCVLALAFPFGAVPVVGGTAIASLLVAWLRSAPAVVAAALIELTTHCSVAALLWLRLA